MRKTAATDPFATLFAVLLAGTAAAPAWGAPPPDKTVLATCSGKATDKEATGSSQFSLKMETPVVVTYEIKANPKDAAPNAIIRIKRKLPNGSFVTIKTLTEQDDGESESSSFPAGDYMLDVSTTHAAFKVTARSE